MEKNTKFPQTSLKGVPVDTKKTQDATNNKLFPRNSRRRESTGTSNFSKSEQSRKSNVQRATNFDKRPKPKGQYHGSSKEDTKVVQTQLTEPGSVMVPGSKKQNLNHLLNFHYEPREMQGGPHAWNHGTSKKSFSRNSNRWLPPVQRHKYNKEQFLQASCQFVVTGNGDYTLYLSDPDVLVDWKLVEQIKFRSSESLSCPICLCSPVAGKMTRCGHVYCWPCILHYLSLSDKSWRKCPICYESIEKSDLKSFTEVTQNTLNSGDIVTLRLMRREKGSLLAVPVGSLTQNPINFFPLSETINNQVYSKLVIAGTEDVMNIIHCERYQLNLELSGNPDSPENCYIEQALDELLTREQELLKMMTSFSVPEVISVDKTTVSTETKTKDIKKQLSRNQHESQDSAQANTSTGGNVKSVDVETLKLIEDSPNGVQCTSGIPKFFYFYQAEDGQHLYLHAMNVKMLEMQYGSLENSPHLITGMLIEKETSSLTEDLRRRLRYLCHLPLTCQFEVAEIELKPPIISEEVLTFFHDQIALRHSRRQQRERAERKREKKITEEENKRMGKYPTPVVHIDSQRHFPQWQPELLFAEETVSVTSPPESTEASSIASSPSQSTFDDIVVSRQTDNAIHEQGPSFAEMLRNKGARMKSQSVWPSVNSTYGKANSSMTAQCSSRNIVEEENYAPAPSYNQSLGDALAAALEQTKLETKKNGAGKKKKKRKSTVLFAATMAHTS